MVYIASYCIILHRTASYCIIISGGRVWTKSLLNMAGLEPFSLLCWPLCHSRRSPLLGRCATDTR